MVSITDYFTKQPAKFLFCNLVEQSKPELNPPAILSKHLCEAIRFQIHWLTAMSLRANLPAEHVVDSSIFAAVGMLCQAYTDLM